MTLAATDDRLDAARQRGDAAADGVVAGLGARAWAINALLAPVATAEDARPAGVPEEIWALVAPALPDWADVHRLRAAQAFADRHLPLITVALFCASLPTSYADRQGARLLASTGRMHHDLDRRVNETARFLFDVLRPNAFDRRGRARVSIGKVRIVHAAVRASFRQRPGCGEVPINEEQMLGTTCLFSTTVLDAIEKLGVTVHPRDAEDYIHLWRVTGALLGIDADALPATRADARALFRHLERRRFAPSDEGRRLLDDLLMAMERHAAIFGMRSVPRAMVRRLLGATMADRMGVDGGVDGCGRAPRPSRWSRAFDEPVRVTALAPRLGRTLLEAVNALKLGARPATFAMPAIPEQERSR